MPTVIDELIVTLGLDPSQFNQESKETADKFLKLKHESGKAAKSVEGDGKKMGEAFSALQKRLLGIAAIFLGGMGLTEFAEHITKVTASTGRLSTQLGLSARELSSWEMAGNRVGASSDEIAGSIKSLTGQLQQFQITGQGSIVQYFNQMGIKLTDSNGKLRKTTDLLMDMSRWARGRDAKLVSEWFREMGMSSGMINLLLQGPDKLGKFIAESKKLAPSPQEVKAAQDLQGAWAKLLNTAQALGRYLTLGLGPGLDAVANKMTSWLDSLSNWLHSNDTWVDRLDRWTGGAISGVLGKPGKPGLLEGGAPAPTPSGPATFDERFNAIKSSAPAHVGRTGWWTPQRKQHAVDYLVAHGISELGARALVARWSGVESTGSGPNAVNGIGAEGIAQWLGNRQRGYRLGDFDSQLGHVVDELKTTEKRAGQTLMNARTAREAAIGASQYERAEGYNGYADAYVAKTLSAMRDVPGPSKISADHAAFAAALRRLPRAPAVTTGSAAAVSSTTHTSSVSHQNETNIGEIHVHTNATDGETIARDLPPAIRRNAFMNQANYGQN